MKTRIAKLILPDLHPMWQKLADIGLLRRLPTAEEVELLRGWVDNSVGPPPEQLDVRLLRESLQLVTDSPGGATGLVCWITPQAYAVCPSGDEPAPPGPREEYTVEMGARLFGPHVKLYRAPRVGTRQICIDFTGAGTSPDTVTAAVEKFELTSPNDALAYRGRVAGFDNKTYPTSFGPVFVHYHTE